ncbi:MAG TPA: quinone oxidoreductase [Candidatus Polarisedimenticolia bacterium]|nr:quinone oxidoreductase [Candidatus Polarisedimenticolia bacterium]
MTRVVRIHQTGGPEMLRLEEIDPGRPGPGEVLLRQTALGVNFIDTYHRTGLYPLPSLPHVLGQEGAGVVEEVGSGVTGLAQGMRVAYAGGTTGAYAERRLVPAARLVPLPDDIDDRTAAGMMLRGMTAEYLIRRTFKVEPGMWVLFHAAAGGVGAIACQWLKHLGAKVIGTVGSDAKAERAKKEGCAEVIVYTREPFAERVRSITAGAGVPVVYDSVGKATFEGSIACLARRGMLVAFGNASGAAPPFDPLVLSRKGSLYLTRPTLFDYTATREELLASAGALFDVVRRGAVKVTVGQTFPLAQAAEAHRALESRNTIGSTILIP